MSKLKRNLLLLVAVLLTAKAVYAAVVPIVDTQASSSYGIRSLSSPASSSDGHTSTYSGVECGEQTALSPDGCNTLLGIDNAVATPCDGGKYTCSYPASRAPQSRSAGDEEDDETETELCRALIAGNATYSPARVNAENDCVSKLGEGAAFSDCGDDEKYCYCDPFIYITECTGVGVRGMGASCGYPNAKKYPTCNYLPKCSELSPGVNAEIQDSLADCKNLLGEDYASGQECVSDDRTAEQFYCQYQKCSDITGATIAANNAEKNQALGKGGKIAGVCWNTSTETSNIIIVCGDDYTTDKTANTSCSSGQTPKVCTLEGTPKYHKTQCSCSDDLYPYTTENCSQSGHELAGPSCTADGTTKYSYCLPECDNSEGKEFISLNGECKTDSGERVPQNFGLCNVGSNISSTTGCGSTEATHCCVGNGDNRTCYDNYLIISSSSAYCIPSNEASMTKNLCVNGTDIKWQCACPSSYQTEAECQANAGEVSGAKCLFDGEEKWETCNIYSPCPSAEDNTIVENSADCGSEKYSQCKLSTSSENVEPRYWCQCSGGTSLIEYCENKAELSPAETATKQDRITACEANETCKRCRKENFGRGHSCNFDAQENGQTLKDFIKWESFEYIISCETAKTEMGDISIINEDETCHLSDGTETNRFISCVYAADTSKKYKICQCPENYKTKQELCQKHQAENSEFSVDECLANYTGLVPSCSYDTDPETKKPVIKYSGLGYLCPENVELVNTQEECQINGSDYKGQPKACIDSSGASKYYCSCPPTFDSTCLDPNEVRGGTMCSFDSSTSPKYDKCLPLCDENIGMIAVEDSDDCPYIDGIASKVRNQCFKSKGAPVVSYQCGCPQSQGYETLEEFCGETGVTYSGRSFTKEECLSNFVGQGTVCTYDGNRKYKKFILTCPKDRPLYYTPENCSENGINGSVDYVCQDRDEPALEKIVCKCPGSWLKSSGINPNDSTAICDPAKEEASGRTCDFEGYNNIKYEKCYPLCDKLSTNGQGIHYLEEDKAYEYDCRNMLGEGATFGTDNAGGKCSKNHVLFSPCYCGADYKETCTNDENKRPAENVSTCTINGTTYYNKCQLNECSQESSTLAIVNLSDGDTADSKCKAQYGPGSQGKACGNNQAECSCDARTYIETCEYPFTEPTNASWCKYGDASTLMKNGRNHYKLGECKVSPMMASCGKYILDADGSEDTSPTIYVTETEAQCKSRYGSGAQTQLCEYEGNSDKRAFNCYFRASDFPYTEDNCPVRHVLSKEYVTINGKNHYKSCDCHPAYKYHKYNCAGMLSGGACTQIITQEMLEADHTLTKPDVEEGNTISQYPYCQCTADYNQVCDGERYIGVGTPCNGKYTACECKKDELPENWTDNYYGCPGGKKPTGVTKPNGCGGKYYQCSVTDCTWQHTETCKAPLIGVDACQDNLGNIGGYKSCRCPDGYKTCNNGMAGKGEPCILNGEYYYSACEDKTTCVHGETLTCQQEFLVGVNPCTRNDVTYFEYCKCSAGFDKLCDDGEVGVGPACKLNGKEYYQSCSKPVMACSSEHKLQCDIMQEKYDPCVNSDNQLMYKCKCPSNWTTCDGGMGASGADTCVDSSGTRYFSQCPVSEACTPMQENTYKTCTNAQKGIGNSCVTGDGVTKYAECEDTTACRTNGYQFTCLGFDQTALGTDFCVDDNGNKLYKECKCPTNWITCPGKNNTKGRSCTALNTQGVSQEPVFESCTCDASLYKYTCQAEEGSLNEGVIPSKVNSCRPAVYKDGKREEGEELYQACSCQPEYKYSCKGNGHVVDSDQPYCEQIIGGTKLYKACACGDEFIEMCTGTGQGAPTKTSAICIPANPDALYNEKGIKALYSECGCSEEYKYTCDDDGQIPDGEGCTASGKTLYKACLCSDEYRSCSVSGQNKGIRGVSESEGGKTCKPTKGELLYKECKCDTDYDKQCEFSKESEPLRIFNTNINQDYCELDGIRYYKDCKCPSRYNKTCSGDDIPLEGQYCITSDNEKRYEMCLCTAKGVDGDGFTPLEINGVHILKDQFDAVKRDFIEQVKALCNDEDNYEVEADSCNYVYWKCANSEIINKEIHESTDAYCKDQTPIGSVNWIVSNQKSYSFTTKEFSVSKSPKTVYEVTCSCPTGYTEPEDCSNALLEEKRCIFDGYSSEVQLQYVSCSAISFNGEKALIPTGNYCENARGEKRYQYCRCNPAIFTYVGGSKTSCLCPGVDTIQNQRVWACKDNYPGATCTSKCKSSEYGGGCILSSNYDSNDCSGK